MSTTKADAWIILGMVSLLTGAEEGVEQPERAVRLNRVAEIGRERGPLRPQIFHRRRLMADHSDRELQVDARDVFGAAIDPRSDTAHVIITERQINRRPVRREPHGGEDLW